MLKLYKEINGKLHYWETWKESRKKGVIHSGIVGQEGEKRTIKSGIFNTVHAKIEKEIRSCVREGYREIEIDDHYILLVEYKINDWGTPEDIQKRFDLQDALQEILSRIGLGFCDGGSTGSGTMEACCFVVDFDIAHKEIAENLKNTKFADYSRIYEEV